MNSSEKAKYILENNNFMVISTADESGKPWVSPVAFVYDDELNLYWVSSKEARHSNNVKDRKEVAIVIVGLLSGESLDAVYIDARARELHAPSEIQIGIDLFKAKRPQPTKFMTESVGDVTGNAVWRMYQAKPLEISKRSEDIIKGQTVTVREIVQL